VYGIFRRTENNEANNTRVVRARSYFSLFHFFPPSSLGRCRFVRDVRLSYDVVAPAALLRSSSLVGDAHARSSSGKLNGAARVTQTLTIARALRFSFDMYARVFPVVVRKNAKNVLSFERTARAFISDCTQGVNASKVKIGIVLIDF